MSTGKPRDARKECFWRRMLRQWRRSGLSAREFCEEHDLSEASFYGWRRTIQERDAAQVAFVPVRVVSEPEADAAQQDNSSGLELIVGSGRILRIGPSFDGPTLRRLLTLLEEGQP